MLSSKIKEATTAAHLKLNKTVLEKMKAIRNNADYADFLKYFYTYFSQIEKTIAPFITESVLPDYHERRNSSYLRNDILQLGGATGESPAISLPVITNKLEALGALYVLEGSVMGGSIMVKMLEKSGITEGISFFSGYGAETGHKWNVFTTVLNEQASTAEEQEIAIKAANETFFHFGNVFDEVTAA